MVSCESVKCSAYDEDLRWRMVWQLNYTYQEIGLNLNVDASTVYRTVALFQQTRSVTKRIYSKDRLQRKITPTVELII